MNEYKVTVIIESDEEELGAEFYIGAENFDEVVSMLEEQLDVDLNE